MVLQDLMKEKEFRELVKRDKYQVFLFVSRIPHPLSFVLHSWLVCNKKGKISRWDAGIIRGNPRRKWGYVYMDNFLHASE